MLSTAEPLVRPPEVVPLLLKVDVGEEALANSTPDALELLLADMTTGHNIIWATHDYAHLGSAFAPDQSITVASITGRYTDIIRPRVEKPKTRQGDRAKGKAEVFTPSWLCNEQNNLVDEAWFGRPGVFNTATGHGWRTHTTMIEFDTQGGRTWQQYVDEPRLEAACGEAPYLVSRYDATTGGPIALERRIGLLDRKVRVVTERCRDEETWLHWTRRAFESVYGFEYQGDSLLLARENLLASYVDYTLSAILRQPTESEMSAIARIIAWNIWQMDALTFTIPYKIVGSSVSEPTLFDIPGTEGRPCLIRDWRRDEIVEFRSLLRTRWLR